MKAGICNALGNISGSLVMMAAESTAAQPYAELKLYTPHSVDAGAVGINITKEQIHERVGAPTYVVRIK